MGDKFNDYEKISIATDVVILASDVIESENPRMAPARGLRVMFIRRDEEPFNKKWSLPGGFVNIGAGLEDTAKYKVSLKTGIDDIYIEQLYTYGDQLDRDPRGRVVSVAYVALTSMNKVKINIRDTQKECYWFWVRINENSIEYSIDGHDYNSIKGLDIAFDHANILEDAIKRMQNKVMYTDVAFQLLPDTFTMRELQDVYELLADKKIYSFRKFVENLVEETGDWADVKAHRPAKLYKRACI